MSETKKRRTETESSSSAAPTQEASRNRLPHGVLAVAARNRRNRSFVPDTNNSIGGISFDHVMMDSGCSSILLPFPPDPTVLEAFSGEQYRWQISFSRSTGAVGSLVLKIQPHAQEIGGTFSIVLAGKAQLAVQVSLSPHSSRERCRHSFASESEARHQRSGETTNFP